MNIAGFVITLERAVERRPQRDWILANAPFECEPLNAVDGRVVHFRRPALAQARADNLVWIR